MIGLNLLDTDRKRALSDQALLRTSVRTALAVLGICLATIGSLFAISLSMSQKATATEAELNRTRLVSPSGKALPVAETTRRINNRLETLKTILDEPSLLPYLDAVITALPLDTQLSELEISSTNKTLSAKGIAATRNDIPAMQEKLDQLSILNNTAIRSNINDRTNVEFELTANIVVTPAQQ